MPTVCILIFTLIVIATVIPYAFSTAINQVRALEAREAAEETIRNLMEQREDLERPGNTGNTGNTLIREQERPEQSTATEPAASSVSPTDERPTEIS